MNDNLAGNLLVASPYLSDENFLRTVLLIIKHDEDGAFGLVINRPTEKRLRDFLEMSTCSDPSSDQVAAPSDLSGDSQGQAVDSKKQSDDRVYIGGPCEGPLLAVHSRLGIGEPCDDSADSPWVTGDDDHIRVLLKSGTDQLRLIAHHSGWAPGQLENELRVGGWLVIPAEQSLVFGDPDEVWESAVRRFGQSVLDDIVPHTRSAEFDPELN